MLFSDLNIIEPVLRALKVKGYSQPTPIQEQAIGKVLSGRDLLGTAQTGTGKTAAYAVPILQLLNADGEINNRHMIKALILAPTRELVIQIRDNFYDYGKFLPLRCTAVFGGVSQVPQVRAIKSGVDILVATPGRLLDLMNQKVISADNIKILVLDEADQMLDMGFIHDVRKIIAKLPEKRQTLLFSATMPKEILSLANSILKDPMTVAISSAKITVDKIEQSVYFVEKSNKTHLLLYLLKDDRITSALVFSRTKYGANKISKALVRAGIKSEAIHGNKSQSARQLSLANFKEKKIRVLVATDIAARGIDVDELSLVINYDLPNVPETYVHRIGRTGRAGMSGIAISFCNAEELEYLKDIQKLIGQKIKVIEKHPYCMDMPTPVIDSKKKHDKFKTPLHSNGRGKPVNKQNGNKNRTNTNRFR